MKFRVCVSAWSMLICGVLTAEENPPVPPGEPKHQAAVLQRFVGKWTTRSTSTSADGVASTSYTGTMEGRMLGTTWLINEYDAIIDSVPFNALQRLGFDAEERKYVGTWADSLMPYQWPLEGKEDGNRLIVNSKGPNPSEPGATAHFRDVYKFHSANLILSTSQMQADGRQW